MRIAIDLNDVIRDYSNNFVRYYIEGYNHEFNLSDFEFWSNNPRHVFEFSSDASYYNFVYNDYSFELYGKCPTCSKNTQVELNEFVEKTIPDLDENDNVELLVVSPMEYGLSIGNTYFFLSKVGCKIREVYFPINTVTVWDKCDVLITANPDLINSKPEEKVVVKIETEYNKELNGDYNYNSFSSFVKNIDNIKKIINNGDNI